MPERAAVRRPDLSDARRHERENQGATAQSDHDRKQAVPYCVNSAWEQEELKQHNYQFQAQIAGPKNPGANAVRG